VLVLAGKIEIKYNSFTSHFGGHENAPGEQFFSYAFLTFV
jgi:hypothetical protein